ncbi:MAG: acyl-CoA dehydratase activase-related protein [Candidatus Pacebacteria bacterium]|nr:acyl-CoA dehydratase activase-related protein [Candidatus Paceibacterota bacterium]
MPWFWEVFFENLGFEVLLSPLTNKKIIEQGTKVADHETCFSVKVFEGHLLELEDKVDYIFLPRIKSLRKGYQSCPRFLGIPDIAKFLVSNKILAPLIDLNKKSLKKTAFLIGRELKKSGREINQAFEKAKKTKETLKEKENQEYLKKIKSQRKKIVLISHPYNLADEYINLRIEEKLKKLGLEIITIEKVPDNFLPKVLHWDFAQEMIEKTRKILKDCPKLSGAIEISAFQCGCDAVLREYLEKEYKIKKIPFLQLIIDEHTGEAGLLTRLEAFADTL